MTTAPDVAAVRAVLDHFISGWEALDSATVLDTISRDPDLVIWGTDADEHWVGFEEFSRAVAEQVAAFTRAVYVWQEGDPRIRVSNYSAFATGVLDVEVEADSQIHEVEMRSTFILSAERGAWQVVHAHFSCGQAVPVVAY